MNNIRFMEIAPDQKHELRMDAQSHFGTFEVKDDATLYEKVRKLKYSTFVGTQASNGTDPKKYCKSGSHSSELIITKDGIMSNSYWDACVKTINYNLVGKKLKITWSYTPTTKSYNAATYMLSIMMGKPTHVYFTGGGYLESFSQSGGTAKYTNIISQGAYVINKPLDFEMTVEGMQYTCKIYQSNVLIGTITSNADIDYNIISSAGPVSFGGGNGRTNGFDLKTVRVYVDDELIFSGAKTGIDIIKPTNFTVNTTMYCFKQSTNTIYANNTNADASHIPTELYNADGTLYKQSASGWQIVDNEGTITVEYNGNEANYDSTGNITKNTSNSPMVNPSLPWDAGVKITKDGIASGFSLIGNIKPMVLQNWDLASHVYEFELHLPNAISDATHCFPFEAFGLWVQPEYAASLGSKLIIFGWAGSANNYFARTSNRFKTGDDVRLKLRYSVKNSQNNFSIQMSVNGGEYAAGDTGFAAIPATTSSSSDAYICIGSNNSSRYWDGEVDINEYKMFIDGELKQQGMLYIPYTEAELNQKVVDVAYRDRVKDLFEQVGYNGYHTIDETNKNFTLPTHKFSDVIDVYENGLNKWEQRVDRTVRQQGSCTSGTEVTLLKPYPDDEDYALSVPYSAKSGTAFTPSASGEWFAEGKVVL